MEQEQFEVVLGRLHWAAFRDVVREARFNGYELELLEESTGWLERRFVVRGDRVVLAALWRVLDRLKAEQEAA